jgi:N-acetylmuramoyl-L-alanine amidase
MLLSCLFWIGINLSVYSDLAAQKVSPLAKAPSWDWLASCAHTFKRSEFLRILNEHYAPGDAGAGHIRVTGDSVQVRTGPDQWAEVPFASETTPQNPGPARFWRKASELPPAPPSRPLKDLHIAIDPGHLGGEWAQMEARYFQIGKTQPVMEGDLTLQVARKLKPLLEAKGARVSMLRSSDDPVTAERPKSLRAAAAADLSGNLNADRVRLQSELFFYRISEIRARAAAVNERLKPDLVVCLHFNAEEWGNPSDPQLIPRNHLHALVNGCYGARELEWDDVRAEMLEHLFARTAEESLPLNETLAEALAEISGLPPFTYFSSNAKRIGEGPYVYARNLLANRLYKAPVVFLEPYVMNSSPVWKRVQMGDYRGLKSVDGVSVPSIMSEYALGVAQGLARYYSERREVTQAR